jgi:hypothetical protein
VASPQNLNAFLKDPDALTGKDKGVIRRTLRAAARFAKSSAVGTLRPSQTPALDRATEETSEEKE